MRQAPSKVPVSREELELGWVQGCHGLRGSLRIRLYSEKSSSLRKGLEIKLRDARCNLVGAYRINSLVHEDGVNVRLRLGGVETRDQAEKLLKYRLCVEKSQLQELEDDEYYLADVIGARVETRIESTVIGLGTIIGLSSNGVQDLFEVQWDADDGQRYFWLCPAIPYYVRSVSPENIVVDLPRGMLPDQLEETINRSRKKSTDSKSV